MNRHERIDAQSRARRNGKGRLTATLTFDHDNPGLAAWRNNERPGTTLTIPPKSKWPLSSALATEIHRIATHTGTCIKEVGFKNGRQYHIWGIQASVDEAKMQVSAFFKDLNPHLKGRLQIWSKMPSKTPEARRIHEETMNVEDAKEEYRRVPLPDSIFEAIGYFVWPVDDYSPDELFGSSYEALDPIRMETRCYIIYDRSHGRFKIMGTAKDVQEAMCRIRVTCFQIVARQTDAIHAYLFHVSDQPESYDKLHIMDYDGPAVMHTTSPPQIVSARKCIKGENDVLSPGPETLAVRLERQQSINAEHMQEIFVQTVRKLRYYRGNLQMRLKLGTFVPECYKSPRNGETYDLAELEGQFRMPNFVATVTEELGNRKLEMGLLSSFQQAQDFLVPQSAFARSLSDVHPILTVVLTVDHAMGPVQMTKSWQEDGGDYDCISTKWARLEEDGERAKAIGLLDVSLIDPLDGLAWQLEMFATHSLPDSKVPKTLLELSDWYTGLNAEARKPGTTKCWVEFKRPVPNKRTLQQRAEWHYGIRGGDYTLQIAKVQDIVYYPSQDHRSISAEHSSVMYEPRWTVTLVHRKWEMNLSQNSSIEIGRGASWRADIESWFPVDDVPGRSDGISKPVQSGIEGLLEKLAKIQGIARGHDTQKHGGMKVG